MGYTSTMQDKSFRCSSSVDVYANERAPRIVSARQEPLLPSSRALLEMALFHLRNAGVLPLGSWSTPCKQLPTPTRAEVLGFPYLPDPPGLISLLGGTWDTP